MKNKRNLVAASLYTHLVSCSKHGYNTGTAYRWGGSGVETVWALGEKFVLPSGDFDCTASTITVWRAALKGTKYENALGTSTARSETVSSSITELFLKSGLFEKKPLSFKACPGDVYVKVGRHVGMALTYPNVGEFIKNEKGGTLHGKQGDQTGVESLIRSKNTYMYGWDYILHYNGKADPITNTGVKYVVVAKQLNVRSGMGTGYAKSKTPLKKGDIVYLSYIKSTSSGSRWGKIMQGVNKGKYCCISGRTKVYCRKV